jgi:hypothetical protein
MAVQNVTSVEMTILSHMGTEIAKDPKGYKNILDKSFLSSRPTDMTAAERIFRGSPDIEDVTCRLTSSPNNLLRLLGEAIQRARRVPL